MKGITTAALLSCMLPASAYAQFAMDKSGVELNSAAKRLTLNDLAVGERGIVTYPTMCTSKGELFVRGYEALQTSKNEFGVDWVATRQPGGMVSFTFERGAKANFSINTRTLLIQKLADASQLECSLMPWAQGNLVKVSEIDGKRSASEAIDAKP